MAAELSPAVAISSQKGTPIEPIWRGPLVPVALAFTGGILIDRWFQPAPLWTWIAAILSVAASPVYIRYDKHRQALAILFAGAVCLGAAFHHGRAYIYPADDIGNFATEDLRPVLVRGIIDAEPLLIKRRGDDELRSRPTNDGGRLIVFVTAIRLPEGWSPASGRLAIQLGKPSGDLHVGDEIEAAGRMEKPEPPMNPGEFDFASVLRDQRIRAVMTIKDDSQSLRLLSKGYSLSPWRMLAWLRGWSQSVLVEHLPAKHQGVGVALLLGDGAPMTQDDWEKYVRTGVIHVLAISGQHLVVLAVFLGVIFRVLRVHMRQAALLTALFLTGYALLVGGRPPVMRSAAAVWCICGGLLAKRPLVRANVFAAAWLFVALVNPMDIFSSGCQLSFLAVAVLIWGIPAWLQSEEDPLDRLAAEGRPLWQQFVYWLVRWIAWSYGITLAIWIVVAPLVASRQNVVSPVGLLIGPPMVLLSSAALLSGFMLLFLAAFVPPLAHIPAWFTEISLVGCDALVSWALTLPGAYWYVPSMPEWWLWVFYAAVLCMLMLQRPRRGWTWCALALLGMLAIGLVSSTQSKPSESFRCTFLAVGHGSCIVLETPEGQTILYDVGSLRGPEVVRRHVAPFLWQRGKWRIDEVFLSHADLDHFNGLVELLERFAIGQVSYTPTFADRRSPGVNRTVKEIEQRGVGVRVVSAGDRLKAGGIEIDVLHPPLVGPEGNENSRSLVLLIRHASHSILLTGDLEGTGLAQVVKQVAPSVDILQAPHHGNREATEAMIRWASPKLVVSCQAAPKSPPKGDDANLPPILGTWPHGAVSVHSMPDTLFVECFVTRRVLRLK